MLSGAGCVAAAWLAPRLAVASDASSAERVRRLYSKRFAFGADGEPRISVGLMQGRRTVRLSSPSGLLVALSGEDTSVLEAGGRWHVTVGRSRPGRTRYCLVLASLPAFDAATAEQRARALRAAGLDVDFREVGAAFGVRGRSLDARRLLLTTGTFGSERAAREVAKAIAREHGITPRLHPVLEERPSGLVVGRDEEAGIVLRADGALWFRPRDPRTPIEVAEVAHGGIFGEGGRETRRYHGEIYVALDRDGALAVVNRVRETDLLAGLVPAEIFPSAPFEALCAQAVAARGQLVAKVGTRHLGDPFLLCAHQHCQVYAGIAREDPRTTRAVRATRGRLLLRPDRDVLVDTVYSANCGGHTEDNDAVWPAPADPRLRGRPDPRLRRRYPDGIRDDNLAAFLADDGPAFSRPEGTARRDSYRWTATVDLTAVARRLDAAGDGVGPIEHLEVLRRGRSGRANRLRVHGRAGSTTVQGELAIRRLLGGLRSSLFHIEGPPTDGTVALRGAGHGHGVGMCQHGAMGMARAGWSHAKILAHYYGRPRLGQRAHADHPRPRLAPFLRKPHATGVEHLPGPRRRPRRGGPVAPGGEHPGPAHRPDRPHRGEREVAHPGHERLAAVGLGLRVGPRRRVHDPYDQAVDRPQPPLGERPRDDQGLALAVGQGPRRRWRGLGRRRLATVRALDARRGGFGGGRPGRGRGPRGASGAHRRGHRSAVRSRRSTAAMARGGRRRGRRPRLGDDRRGPRAFGRVRNRGTRGHGSADVHAVFRRPPVQHPYRTGDEHHGQGGPDPDPWPCPACRGVDPCLGRRRRPQARRRGADRVGLRHGRRDLGERLLQFHGRTVRGRRGGFVGLGGPGGRCRVGGGRRPRFLERRRRPASAESIQQATCGLLGGRRRVEFEHPEGLPRPVARREHPLDPPQHPGRQRRLRHEQHDPVVVEAIDRPSEGEHILLDAGDHLGGDPCPVQFDQDRRQPDIGVEGATK